MSPLYTPAFADPHYGVIRPAGRGYTLAMGPGVPGGSLTLPAAGYEKGCIFIDLTNGHVYRNSGTTSAATWTQVDAGVDVSGLTATATELNRLDDDNAVLATTAGSAITGSAETYKNSVLKFGSIFYSTILLDLTGLDAIATDGDIIGKSTAVAHLGQITAARSGTIAGLRMTCLEAPAGASADIDLFTANEATGKLDDAVSGLTETVCITAGGSWTNGAVKGGTGLPAANDYLYLTNGAGANAGTYTAGKFLIELFGY